MTCNGWVTKGYWSTHSEANLHRTKSSYGQNLKIPPDSKQFVTKFISSLFVSGFLDCVLLLSVSKLVHEETSTSVWLDLSDECVYSFVSVFRK